mgnify:CR=1 FL=1
MLERLPEPRAANACGPSSSNSSKRRQACSSRARQMIVISEEAPPEDLLQECALLPAPVVKCDWLLDSISYYALQSLPEYAHSASS